MFYFCEPQHQPLRKVPNFYSNARFRVTKIQVRFYKDDWLDKFLSGFLRRFVNKSLATQVFYERHLSNFFPAWEIEFSLEKVIVS
jgi:hypothetical protein